MSEIEDTRKDINTYNEYISQNKEKIRKLEEKYDEGVELKKKLKTTEKDLESIEEGRKEKMAQMRNMTNVSFIKGYADNMQDILSGTKRTVAYKDIETAIENVNEKIKEIEKEIETLEAQNKTYDKKIDSCENEITRLKKEEREKKEV